MRKYGCSHNPRPDLVTGGVHVKSVLDKQAFGFASFVEHRRDHIDVVEVGAFGGPVSNRVIDQRLKRKLREAQLRGLERDEIHGRVVQSFGLVIHELVKIRHDPFHRLAGVKIVLARVKHDGARPVSGNEVRYE